MQIKFLHPLLIGACVLGTLVPNDGQAIRIHNAGSAPCTITSVCCKLEMPAKIFLNLGLNQAIRPGGTINIPIANTPYGRLVTRLIESASMNADMRLSASGTCGGSPTNTSGLFPLMGPATAAYSSPASLDNITMTIR